MALPGGVTTCTVTYGSALTYLGAVSSISATLTADRSVVWAATGQSLNSGSDSVTATAGAALSFAVPHVDQAGFVYADGTAATNWFYTLTGVVTFTTGTKMTFRKNFQVFVGQSNLDLDTIADDATVLPAVVVVAEAVTSVASLTGAVTAQQIADAVVAATDDTDWQEFNDVGSSGIDIAVRRTGPVAPGLWRIDYTINYGGSAAPFVADAFPSGYRPSITWPAVIAQIYPDGTLEPYDVFDTSKVAGNFLSEDPDPS